MKLSVRKKELITGWLTLLLFFGGFLISELTLRLIQLNKFGAIESIEKTKQFFVVDKIKLRLPYPNQKIGNVRINNFGFRGPDITLEKPNNLLRIAFLGSSTTYDADVAEDLNWPYLTAKKLQDLLPGCQVDFINAGLPGFDTIHMLKYWKYQVAKFEPDIVVVLSGDMTGDIQVAARKNGFKGFVLNKSWLARHSLLWEKIEKNINVIKTQRLAFSEQDKFTVDSTALASKFGEQLNQLIRELQVENNLVIVPTISNHLRKDANYQDLTEAAGSALYFMPYVSIPSIIKTQEAYNKEIIEVAKVTDALLVANEELIPGDFNHFVDSRHFNANGSDKMSERIINRLKNSIELQNLLRQKNLFCEL